jgi:hypothetical protein
MDISLDDIQNNLKKNKIYLQQDIIQVNHITYPKENNIFNDILLKNLFKKSYETIQSLNNKNNEQENIEIKNINYKLKFHNKNVINTFINELINYLYERTLLDTPSIRDFKEKFLNFVNNDDTKEYLKSFSRSYKKLQFKLNDIFNVKNIDEHLNDFPEFIKLICKLFNFNILIISNNFYKLYKINDGYFLIFYRENIKYKNDNKKIYKFDNDYNNIIEMISYINKYYDKKEISKMKLEDLTSIKIKLENNGIKIDCRKKIDLVNKLIEIYSSF